MGLFKNTSQTDLYVRDYGLVKAGEVVELPPEFHNGNFIRVKPTTAPKTKNIDNNFNNNIDES